MPATEGRDVLTGNKHNDPDHIMYGKGITILNSEKLDHK